MKFPLTLAAALFFRRLDPSTLVAVVILGAAVALGAFVVPARDRALGEALARLEAASREAAAPAQAATQSPQERLDAFRRTLASRLDAERHIETVLGIAREKQLTVRKAEYRTAYIKAGDYHVLQMTLPFQSGYGPVRAFGDEVLRSLPFASLDAVSFSRNTVDVTDLDAKIVLTFFLADPELSASAAVPAKRSSTAIPRQAVIR